MSRSTFSKHSSQHPDGTPSNLLGGSGAWVWDQEGNKYLDWAQGLGGTGVFGHNPPFLRHALRDLVGTSFHLPHPLEERVAQLLKEMLPWAEETRFCLNGTDAVAGAVRLARAVRKTTPIGIFKGAYHGASTGDWFIASQEPARGIRIGSPRPTLLDWNDPDTFYHIWYPLAAIVFEVKEDAPTPEFIREMHTFRKRTGTLIIADEVVTGFRLHLQGACGRYNIQPDLACYGKALGSGVPIAALVGKKELMQEFDLAYTNSPVFMSFTHAGNALGLAAAKATLVELSKIYNDPLAPGWISAGSWLMRQAQDLIEHYDFHFPLDIKVCGQEARSIFKFPSQEAKMLFRQKMTKNGVLTLVANYPTTRHLNKRVQNLTLDALDDAFSSIAVGKPLEGDLPRVLYT